MIGVRNTTTEPHRQVADRVRAEMERRGVSQPTLARHLGVAQATVWRRLSGEVAFDITELAAVAQFLDVPLTDLISAPERAE